MKYLGYLLLLQLLSISVFAEEDDSLGLPEADEEYFNEPDVVAILKARQEYNKGLDKLKIDYRSRFAEALKHADSAEIFLLSFTMEREIPEDKESEYLHIAPYNTYSKILKRKKLDQSKLKELCSATIKLLQEKSTDGGAFCHYPIHGIRLLRGKRVIFQTSLCWKCSNYFFHYSYSSQASWVGLEGTVIKEFLDREMPIPQSEIDRFNAKYGKKKKAPKTP